MKNQRAINLSSNNEKKKNKRKRMQNTTKVMLIIFARLATCKLPKNEIKPEEDKDKEEAEEDTYSN